MKTRIKRGVSESAAPLFFFSFFFTASGYSEIFFWSSHSRCSGNDVCIIPLRNHTIDTRNITRFDARLTIKEHHQHTEAYQSKEKEREKISSVSSPSPHLMDGYLLIHSFTLRSAQYPLEASEAVPAPSHLLLGIFTYLSLPSLRVHWTFVTDNEDDIRMKKKKHLHSTFDGSSSIYVYTVYI